MSKSVFIAEGLRPADDAEIALFAQEEFVAELQVLLHDMMERKGISRSELAKRLGVSKPRISQFFAGDGSNLTARTIAKIFHALGERAEVTCLWQRQLDEVRSNERQRRLIAASGGMVTEIRKWQGEKDWGLLAEGDCHDGADISSLVANSRRRRPISISQAA